MTRIGLTTTHHDPEGRLYDQMVRLLPTLQELYGGIVVRATTDSQERTIEALRSAGVQVEVGGATNEDGILGVGHSRRQALAAGLVQGHDYLHLCDFDRLLHWADHHRDELVAVLSWLPTTYDFVVLGRTERAFQSHPRVQRDTERIINFIYSQVSGDSWDVTAASRGISRRAAEVLIAQSSDDTIGNDCSWPLLLRQVGGLTLGYWPTDGLEFETADRYPEEVAAAGGVEAWKAQLDKDPATWERRLELARIEIASLRQVVG